MPLASFSTVMDAVVGLRLFDGRPRPGLDSGTWSPGSSVQIAMHVGDENLVRVVQLPQKTRLLAITAVHADPGEPYPPGARPAHDVERMCSLRGQLARRLRDASCSQRAGPGSSGPADRAACRPAC